MRKPGRRFSFGWPKRSPKTPFPLPPQPPTSHNVQVWVQPPSGRSPAPSAPLPPPAPDPSPSPRHRINILVSSHRTSTPAPSPDNAAVEDLASEPLASSPIRLLVTPRDRTARDRLLMSLLLSLVWMGMTVSVFGGGWVALQLVINPGSVGWLSWVFPEWSREAKRYQRDAPKTLAELKVLAQEEGLTLGTPLPLADGSATVTMNLLIPVLHRPKGCGSEETCHRIQELRVYYGELGQFRDVRYRLGDRLPVQGPDEFFVTAPLAQMIAMSPGSTRQLPLDQVEPLATSPTPGGIWFLLTGTHQAGSDRIRFGYVGWYDSRWQQLRLVMPWTSPAGELPRWQPITGSAEPELVIDQTIGLEPNYRVYQVRPPAANAPVQLAEISLQPTPIDTTSYANALLLARHRLWSPALAVLESIRTHRGNRWPAYAQAQMDVIRLHADVTRQNADRDWANPSQTLMAKLLDGQWETAWDSLMQGLQTDPELIRVLRPEANHLWQRVGAAARVSPQREAIQRWVSLMYYTRQGRGAAIAWLQQQNGATLVSHRLDARSRRILQQIDETMLGRDRQPATPVRFYGTGTAVTQPDPRNWQQPDASVPQLDPQHTWYRIPIAGMDTGQGWQRAPFPELLGPAPTPRYLWNQLGLAQDAELQLITWDAAGQPHNRRAIAHSLRWSDGTLEILASGDAGEDPLSGPVLAYTRASFTWQTPHGNTRLQDWGIQNPPGAAILAQHLDQELQQAGIESDAEQELGEPPFFAQGEWLVQLLDLTGDGQLEVILNLHQMDLAADPPDPPRTLIFSAQGTLLYSELSRNRGQQMLAIATTQNGHLPRLVIRQGNHYRLGQWSSQTQRFE